MDRIAKAEEELQSVIQNRSKLDIDQLENSRDLENSVATVDHFGHDDSQSKERWRQELESRMSDLGKTETFPTNEPWNENSSDKYHYRDADVFTEAVMSHIPPGDQCYDCLATCLVGSPYEIFGDWFATHCSERYRHDAPLAPDGVLQAVHLFLAFSQTLSDTAANAGASSHHQFGDNMQDLAGITPGVARSSVSHQGHDLVDFIQLRGPEKAPVHVKQGKVVVHVTVEIGDGRSGTIDVREGDTAQQLALEFVKMHALVDEVVGPLTGHIQSSIEAVRPSMPSERKRSTKELAHKERSSPLTLESKVAKADWVARMSQPLGRPKASMDPSRSMGTGAVSCGSFSEQSAGDWATVTPQVSHLGMTADNAYATQTYMDSLLGITGTDERGAQLSARMRGSATRTKKGTKASARLYKDATQRQAKEKARVHEAEEEEKQKLETTKMEERRKWCGAALNSGPTQPRYVVDPATNEQVRVGVHLSLYQDYFKREQKRKVDAEKQKEALEQKEAAMLEKSKREKWGEPKISKQAQESTRSGSQVRAASGWLVSVWLVRASSGWLVRVGW